MIHIIAGDADHGGMGFGADPPDVEIDQARAAALGKVADCILVL